MNCESSCAAPPRQIPYAELHCLSNFTFLRGASHPQELIERAIELGYMALAITDECSMAGVVRAHVAARDTALKLLIGAEFRLECGLKLVAIAMDRAGYGRLCRLITRGRCAAVKGKYCLKREDVEASGLQQCFVLWTPCARRATDPRTLDESRWQDEARWLSQQFGDRARIAVELFREGTDRQHLLGLQSLGREWGLRLVASGDVHMHGRERRRLQDALTAVRLNVPIAQAGWHLYPNGERHLRDYERLVRIYPQELLAESITIAQACTFSLDELRYEYPHELVPAGETPSSHLRKLVEKGVRKRWPEGVPGNVRTTLESELALIEELRYEPYFLTVQDIVAYARANGILCQGRGSAANSLVCYSLEVSAVGPERGAALLFERFISRERNEPPDIDIDFEHDRREEVIQYIYRKYGRDRAAIAATVIMYRPRSALRDMARIFGLDSASSARLSQVMQWWDGNETLPARVREAGFDMQDPILQRIVSLARQLVAFPGFPRHLSQHVGGFVISEGLLEELVPIENATMPERTVVQWDKDDLNDLGLLKVDVLALGMLSALRRAFALVNDYRGTRHVLGGLPDRDAEVYAMMSRADTVGVFQIESRAQMSMLPRLKPNCYYDLVIEVAIVRPGPIQGDMVHPYLQCRAKNEPIEYPSDAVAEVLRRTLGVPIFQEQVMQLAIVAAGFSPGEADRLRRAMGAWKKSGGIEHFRDKLLGGMQARGYEEEFAQRLYRQMLGFGEFGFPESHAASFALLVYDSAWLKLHEPAAFTCALLNSQPMGFYAPAQLVRDARGHGVEVWPVDVQESAYDCTLARRDDGEPALRLGMRMVKSLSQAGAMRVEAARPAGPFTSVQDLARRAALDRGDLEALAAAGALAALSGNRHLAYWEVAGAERPLPLAAQASSGHPGSEPLGNLQEGRPLLAAPTEGQGIVADYASVGLTLERHPLALLRERLSHDRILRMDELDRIAHGRIVRTAGIVLMRQRPGSANGVTFVTIEDESGQVNVIVWENVGRQQRRAMLESRLLEVHGELQYQEGVRHLIARRLVDRSALLGELLTRSRDFH
ncbi:MAG TPA: error-prone DNA polymerase [Steroidobacteraceae bacterium]|nr:error-prone DNA polymerase [Steroidobacteraceae bacterium]